MIQYWSYLVKPPELPFDELSARVGEYGLQLSKVRPSLRGIRTEQAGDRVRITLRVAGSTRWDVQHDASRLLSVVLRKLKVKTSDVVFESILTEAGRRALTEGKGRTPRVRRPRSERMADGRPWDHIAWEQDDV